MSRSTGSHSVSYWMAPDRIGTPVQPHGVPSAPSPTSYPSPQTELPYSGPKYAAFEEEVLAVLQSFDRATDWADFIDLLQRFMVVLRRYPQFPAAVPSLVTVGKRLAQCCNPALPSGVHIKALEVYQLLFSRISSIGLARNLHIFCSGLFPLFSQASTNVKSVLIDLYESEFLRLGEHLLPCLQGFLLALLPGLEDETSVFYGRTMRLLNKTERRTHRIAFYSSLWRCVLASSHVRLPALHYLQARLPASVPVPPDKVVEFFPLTAGVLPALTACLFDSNILVQVATKY